MEMDQDCHDGDDDRQSYVSDGEIDSDLEARLYSQIHHEQYITEDVEDSVNQIQVARYATGVADPPFTDENEVSAADKKTSVSIADRLNNLLKKARTKMGFSSEESKKSKKNRKRKIEAEKAVADKLRKKAIEKSKKSLRKQKIQGGQEVGTKIAKKKLVIAEEGLIGSPKKSAKKLLKKDKLKTSKKTGQKTESSESAHEGVSGLALPVKQREVVQTKKDKSSEMEASTSAAGSRFAENDSRVPPEKRRIRVFSSSSSSDSVVDVMSSEEEAEMAVNGLGKKRRRLMESPSSQKRLRTLKNTSSSDSMVNYLSSSEEEEAKGARSVPNTIVPTAIRTSLLGIGGRLSDVVILTSDEDVGSSDESDVCVIGQRPVNRNDWKILDNDLKDVNDNRKRYYSARARKSIECHNCRMPGHMSRACPLPAKINPCSMCGEEGHLAPRCPNYSCFVCGLKDHDTKYCHVGVSCKLCNRLGHRDVQCPDSWRIFHATTIKDQHKKLVQLKPRQTRSCYNCAGQGHFGHECSKERTLDAGKILPNSPALSEKFVAANGLGHHRKNELPHARNWENNRNFKGHSSSNYEQKRTRGSHQRYTGHYR